MRTYYTGYNGAMADRWITGNWGEDGERDVELEYEREYERDWDE